jgi:REP element-mobilizing transposase RayT
MSHDRAEVEFGIFDRDADVIVSQRYLPHWFQPNVAAFITFRAADSLPKGVVELWRRGLEDWLVRRGLDPVIATDQTQLSQAPRPLRDEFRRVRDRTWHEHLDFGHGACVLAEPHIAQIVAATLKHFDGDRYDLDSFIVMPNHVHVLVQFRPPTSQRKQCTSWLKYSATQVNAALGSHGSFWQSEPFDHLVRLADQFAYLQRYIAENGIRAKLSPTMYFHWSRATQ